MPWLTIILNSNPAETDDLREETQKLSTRLQDLRVTLADRQQATKVMLEVHSKGKGVCGIFPYDLAETKATQVVDYARSNEHPLICTVETDD